jgi:hypothetical protein
VAESQLNDSSTTNMGQTSPAQGGLFEFFDFLIPQ